MCGLGGVLEFDSLKIVARKDLLAMNQAIAHRGPDDEGIYLEKNIGLSNRRLSIIDVAGGHQPIHNEDKSLWIIFNGEIYNFSQLRKSLIKKGHKFYTKTDTETILHLYEEEGINCLKKLDGMFALAIWDRRAESLFLARDPLGKKPLHWTVFENKFIFSSEIKGILAYPRFKKEIDSQSLVRYLLYGFVPAPDSIFSAIKKLLPGYFMVVGEKGIVKQQKYWEIDYSRKIQKLGEKQIKKQVVKLLKEAVGKRLIADVPLGVFLSGGVDSGLVVAMMSKFITPAGIQAFTIGFEEKNLDESGYARMVAKHLGVKYHLKIFSEKELLALVPRIADFLDEPMSDPSFLPTFLLSSFTRERVKVALSGDGGDESFAGYPKYLAHWFLEKTRLGKFPFANVERLFSGKAGKWGSFLRHASYPLYLRNQLWISPFSPKEVEKLTGEKANFPDLAKYHQLFNGQVPLDEAFFLDQKLTLPDLYLVKTDRASMAVGLEVRCPFLDKKLVKFCAQIPFGSKLKGFKTKSLLKEIALDYLPEEAVMRPKMGFGIPLGKWLAGELKLLVRRELLPRKIKKEGILNYQQVKEILEHGSANQIWNLLVFELWLKKWLKN